MKNPLLLFIVWMLTFLGSGVFFSTPFSAMPLWLSFYVLAYIYYFLNLESVILLGSVTWFLTSLYSSHAFELLLFWIVFYLGIHFFKKRTLRPSILAKSAFSFVCLLLFYLFLQDWALFEAKVFLIFLAKNIISFLINFICGILMWWILEEKGSLIEEKYFSSKMSAGQLDLFSVRDFRIARKSSRVKLQKRIRRRFGLKDGW